jgi:hypothetical protein
VNFQENVFIFEIKTLKKMAKIIKRPAAVAEMEYKIYSIYTKCYDLKVFTVLKNLIEFLGHGSIESGTYRPNNCEFERLDPVLMLDFRVGGEFFHGLATVSRSSGEWDFVIACEHEHEAKRAAEMVRFVFDLHESSADYEQFFVQVDGCTFHSLDSDGIVVRNMKQNETYWYEYNG